MVDFEVKDNYRVGCVSGMARNSKCLECLSRCPGMVPLYSRLELTIRLEYPEIVGKRYLRVINS